MVNFAKSYIEKIGTMQGDVEVLMYKLMKSSGLTNTTVRDDSGTYNLKIAPSPETAQIRAVFVNDIPAMRTPVETLVNALGALENSMDNE